VSKLFQESRLLIHPGDAYLNLAVNIFLLCGLFHRFGWFDGGLIYAALKFIAPATPRVPVPSPSTGEKP
jgi:hypothetical protein